MDAIILLLLSIVMFGVAAVASLFIDKSSRNARMIVALIGACASVVGLIAAILGALDKHALFEIPNPLPFGHFVLQMDGLSTLMIGMVSLIGLAVSIYSIDYLEQFLDRNLGVMGFFTYLFFAMMLLVVTIANAFYFLIFWEMMTLFTYFLISFENEKQESVRAGYLYMLVAHAGAALIMFSFFIFYFYTGSFDFDAFRSSQLSPIARNLVFLMTFIGFGAKAGMVPLHFWLPGANPAAPAHISATLSGVMEKTAIYGILRICVDILGTTDVWWGGVVLFFGAITAVFGVFYALVESDLKRLLTYSSIEHIGIILLGIGTGMIGMATDSPAVALLGFLAALYHALNHSFFKGLLFIGAGSVEYRLKTRNLNSMGGLGRLMPYTAVVFLIGGLAVSAIPPLNGFVSEWLVYKSIFAASLGEGYIVRAIMPLNSILLAVVGALSLMVAIKMYAGIFTGPARSEQAAQAKEVPGSMIFSMVFLAAGCLLLGLGAPLVVPYLSNVVFDLLKVPAQTVTTGIWEAQLVTVQTILSIPLIAVLLVSLLVVPLIIVLIYGGFRAGRRQDVEPWSCGYGYKSHMSVTASSFDQPVRVSFPPFYKLRTLVVKPFRMIASAGRSVRAWIVRAEPVIESSITRPTVRLLDTAGQWIQALQMGDIRVYCLYIIITLTILLIAVFGRGGL